jgi:hypothetical protein
MGRIFALLGIALTASFLSNLLEFLCGEAEE